VRALISKLSRGSNQREFLSFARQADREIPKWDKGKADASFVAVGRFDNDAAPTAQL
jgi:hypothetical protein